MSRLLPILIFMVPWLAAGTEPTALERYAVVTAAPVSTWVYVGSVTLAATPFQRHGAQYLANYSAKMFPYFFYSESGSMAVNVSPASLLQLSTGRAIGFSGLATRSDGAARPIEGTATPTSASGGNLKVKIHVSRKITLVFDTTYRLADQPPPLKASAAR